MKRLTLPFLVAIALAACSQSPTISFQLDMDVTDPADVTQLTQQTFNVMQRRLESMGEAITDMETTPEGSGSVIITLSAEHQEALDALSEQMQEPFSLEIMAQAEEGQEADKTVEGHGGFVKTGITADDLEWVEADQEPGTDLGRVHLIFVPDGRTKMADLFKRMKGKNIGIFVRGMLVSKLLVDTDTLNEDIVIQNIPTLELAYTFADDVNSGIHVTVTPLP